MSVIFYFILRWHRCRISGYSFLLLSFEGVIKILYMTTFLVKKRGLSENIIISVKTSSKHHHFSENFIKTSSFQWKLYHFEQTKLSFDDFLMTTSEQENESERKKKTQILRLGNLWLFSYSCIIYERCWLIKIYLSYLKTTLNALIFNSSPLVSSSLCHFTCQMDHHPIVSLNYESAKSLTWYCSNCLWIVCKDRKR